MGGRPGKRGRHSLHSISSIYSKISGAQSDYFYEITTGILQDLSKPYLPIRNKPLQANTVETN